MDLGPMELIIIFAVFLILFGANKLPSLGEGLGKALRSFKEAMRGDGEGSSPAAPGAERERAQEREKPQPQLPAAQGTPATPVEKTEERVRQGGKGAT